MIAHCVATHAVDVALGLDLNRAGISQIRPADRPSTFDQVEVVLDQRRFVRDLLTTISRARVDDPAMTRELLDAFMICDAEVTQVEARCIGDYVGEEMSWETHYNRAVADRDYAEQKLVAHLTGYAGSPVAEQVVELSVPAARRLGGQLLVTVHDIECTAAAVSA